MPEYRAGFRVRLREGVLDPAGQAVEQALGQLGLPARDVTIGKLIELTLSAGDAKEALRLAERMARDLLVNPVLEDYTIEVSPR